MAKLQVTNDFWCQDYTFQYIYENISSKILPTGTRKKPQKLLCCAVLYCPRLGANSLKISSFRWVSREQTSVPAYLLFFFPGDYTAVPTNVTVSDSTFRGNTVTDRGGAVNLQAGTLAISGTLFDGNQALVASVQDIGTGGALSVIDACSGGKCPSATASLFNCTFLNNFAFQAGGGAYYNSRNPGEYLHQVSFLQRNWLDKLFIWRIGATAFCLNYLIALNLMRQHLLCWARWVQLLSSLVKQNTWLRLFSSKSLELQKKWGGEKSSLFRLCLMLQYYWSLVPAWIIANMVSSIACSTAGIVQRERLNTFKGPGTMPCQNPISWVSYITYKASDGHLIFVGSFFNFTSGQVTGNRVQYTLQERNKNGLGGGIYIGNQSFILNGLTVGNNSAYFGGGLFFSADFGGGGVLSNIIFQPNYGLLGRYPDF